MLPKLVVSILFEWSIGSEALGQQSQPIVHFSNPAGLAVPKGYSQLVEVDLGTVRMVIISGQVAMDSTGNVVGKRNPAVQFDQIFRNIQAAVKAVHGKMENVVKLTYYLRDVANLPAVRDARDNYINRQCPPASTAVEVSNLFKEEFLGEVEATVIIPKGK